jgi:ParB family chromosome partitioning protein
MTQEEVAVRVGRSRPAITNALRLLTLPDELIELVCEGKLPAGSARALMGLKDKNKDNLLQIAHEIIKSEKSVREVESLVKALNRIYVNNENGTKDDLLTDKNGKKDVIDVNYTLEAQKRLTKALGRKAAIRHGQNKSVIEIEFHGKDDFNALFDALVDFGKSKLGGHDND